MHTKGRFRHVFVIGPVVVKIPQFRILHLYFSIRNRIIQELNEMRQGKTKGFSRHFFKEVIMRPTAELVFSGLLENWNEALLYISTPHKLLAKLYLPLILINIYAKEGGAGCFTFEDEEWIATVARSGSEKQLELMLSCLHTFDNRENFAYSKGKVKILDYGEGNFKKLLAQYGDQIEEFLLSKAIK